MANGPDVLLEEDRRTGTEWPWFQSLTRRVQRLVMKMSPDGKAANWLIESFFDDRSLTATRNPVPSTRQTTDIQCVWGGPDLNTKEVPKN